MLETATQTSLSGRTIRWTFEDGPTAGATYEHTFGPDGKVTFTKMGDHGKSGKPGSGKEYASFEVAPGVELVSYLGDAGYTLTVAMNFDTGRLYGYASSEKEWHPLTGTMEVVK